MSHKRIKYKISVIHSHNYRIKNDKLSIKMRDFTDFYINRMSQNPLHVYDVTHSNTFDEGLETLTGTSDFIILMSSGNRIYNSKHIMDKIISQFDENENLSMMGHILDRKDEWYEVHPQFVVIRTKHWLKSGRPSFGLEGDIHNTLTNIVRSDDNFHDDYTPIWVKKGGDDYISDSPLRYGWSMLNGLLSIGFEVSPFTYEIRNMKSYCYPEYNSDKFYSLILNKEYTDNIDYTKRVLLDMLINPNPWVWGFNTEELTILKKTNSKKYEKVFLPCAGFKFLDLIHSNLIDDKSDIVFYDYNIKSIEWFEHLMSSKETDIVQLIKNRPKEISLMGKRVEPLFIGEVPSEHLNNHIKELYEYLGGEESFKDYLTKFRTLNISFIHTNIIEDHGPIVREFINGNNLINISNIFSTDYINLFYTKEEREQLFDSFIKDLGERVTIVGRGVDTYYFEREVN